MFDLGASMQDHNSKEEEEFDELLILNTTQKDELYSAVEASFFHLTLFASFLVNFIYVNFLQQTAVMAAINLINIVD
jgi:hypothetical protein